MILNPGTYWMLVVFESNNTVVHGMGPQYARYRTLMAPAAWNTTPPNPFPATIVDDTATPANYYLVGLFQ